MSEFSLIANSGLQFVTTEVDFNPSEPVMVNEVPMPPLFFAEYPSGEPNINCFEMAYKYQGANLLVSELRNQHCIKTCTDTYGETNDCFDAAGQPVIDNSKINIHNLWDVNPNQCYTEFNAEGSFQLFDDTGNTHTPWDRIIGKWLPVPFFHTDEAASSRNCSPTSWCRMRIDEVAKGKKTNRYRLTWAFDTALSDDAEDNSLPFFPQNTHSFKFGICNKVPQYIRFLEENTWVGDYLGTVIFGTDTQPAYQMGTFTQRCRHLGYYISLFTQLRAIKDACPQITLYNDDLPAIKMDLVLDIGNSRTCGVLYEGNDLTTGTILSLRDIEQPWKVYDGSFDMRLAFHRVEFGNNNMGVSNVFNWRSFVRIGEEAKRLISTEQKATGVSARLTHHSSPKRYLWDSEPYLGKWEFLLTEDEQTSPQKDAVYVKRLTEQFKVDGTFKTAEDNEGMINSEGSSFSRRFLMTMVMIEILQQATMQANSYDYVNVRTGRGQIDRARIIDHIVITCPTAMSHEEQIALRRCAHDAYIAIQRSKNPNVLFEPYDPKEWDEKVHIIPNEEDLKITRQEMFGKKVEWGFDEATCCQMVYLYSEIINKYKGNCQQVMEAKGHIRQELLTEGYEKKSLTIGSIDIGAGTTDLMICTYKCNQTGGHSNLTPVPLFWDSFNAAGDDLLQEIITRVVLCENHPPKPRPGIGSIHNAIACRLAGNNITTLSNTELEVIQNSAMAQVIAFFSEDAPAMSALDRIMRNDFNTQISVPIAQKMMDMMKNMDVARDLSYEEIFTDTRPSAALLEYVVNRFGIRIQELKWTYSPDVITECIRSRIEPLLKQLSIILHTYQCDIVLLAGRPTSLEAITDLFLKFFPVSPDRLIRLLPKNDQFLSDEKKWNCYKVGRWFPTSDSTGYFRDLKPVVAVGAMIAFKAEHGNLPNFHLDMSEMRKRMTSTANYIGIYNASLNRISQKDILLSPDKNSATFTVPLSGKPFYLGCKQINTEYYQSRPLYVLKVKTGADISNYDLSSVRITVNRIFSQNKEELVLQNAIDRTNQPITDILELKIQSLVVDSNSPTNSEANYWLDNGAFHF